MTSERHKGPAWTLIALLGAVILGFAVLVALLVSLVVQERAATAAFEEAAADYTVAVSERTATLSALGSTRAKARETYLDVDAVLAELPPQLLDDPGVLDELDSRSAALIPVAGLQIADDGSVQLSPPATFPTETLPEKPSTRAERHAVAAQLTAKAVAVRASARALENEHDRIEAALAGVDEALRDAAASALARGSTSVPPRAPEPERGLYLAALAAFEPLDAEARPAALLRDFAGTWNALIEAHEAVLLADAVAARTGVGCEAIEPTYIQGVLLVNKSYPLPCTFGDGFTSEAAAAFSALAAAASTQGHQLRIGNDWRSYQTQRNMYDSAAAWQGREAADSRYARPGHSEHQAGLALDLDCGCPDIGARADGRWVAANAHHYGFIVRYPEGKTHLTGYMYEPWHLRYVGIELATILYDSDLTLEEYFGVDSRYRE